MLVIRLQRTGRHNLAAYRVVVAEKSKAVKKEAIAIVGHYLPTQNPKVLEIDLKKVEEWISKGAQPSQTVASLLQRLGMAGVEKYLAKPAKTAKRKKGEPEPKEAPAAPVAETPAEPEAAPVVQETPAVETPAETEAAPVAETPEEPTAPETEEAPQA